MVSRCAAGGAVKTTHSNPLVSAEVVRIDGTSLTGSLIRVAADGILLECPEKGTEGRRDEGTKGNPQSGGTHVTVPLDELRLIRFHGADSVLNHRAQFGAGSESLSEPQAPARVLPNRNREEAVFYLAAGGALRGVLARPVPADEPSAEAVVISGTSLKVGRPRAGAWGSDKDRVKLSFASLAGIWLGQTSKALAASRNTVGQAGPKARKVFDDALANRLAGKDVLVTLHRGEVGTIRGRLVTLGPKGGRILFNKKERAFAFDRVVGVVFATGLESGERWPATVHLDDGTSFAARPICGTGFPAGQTTDWKACPTIRFGTVFADEIDIAVDRLAWIEFRSDRVVYLSGLTPAREDTRGLVHPPVPARFDRSVSNGPLAIDGQQFQRGLGVHARSTLEYAIDNAYETFATTIGIDDAVRPRGNVVFRIEGDGRSLFDSGPVTGRDPPRNLTVDLRGVALLSLIVEFGEDLDLSDHADWADARLIRPPATLPSAGDEL
ncbi:MAG: NPCBM/NEW2 domain-containing protein [Phycisphaerae bacterium]